MRFRRNIYISTPETATSFDPTHWQNPQQCEPDRYKGVPTSAQIDEGKCRQIGLERCPFDITTWPVSDGRKIGLSNSGLGTMFGVGDGKPLPMCDYVGFALFGFISGLPWRTIDDRGVRRFSA